MGTHLRNPSLGNKLIIMPLFFFLPGYVRLLLLFIGFFFYDRAYILLPLYSIAAILDTGCIGGQHWQESSMVPALQRELREGHLYLAGF
jgi:hypothetical protein